VNAKIQPLSNLETAVYLGLGKLNAKIQPLSNLETAVYLGLGKQTDRQTD